MPAPFDVLYGVNPVREALRAGRRKARKLLLARREASPETKEVTALCAARGVEIVPVERDELIAVLSSQSADAEASAQGLALVVTPYRYYSVDEIAGSPASTESAGSPATDAVAIGRRRRLLALDGIEDPRNLGAMARTAEVAGFRGMLIQEHRAAAVTAAAVKASAGATEHLRIARPTNLADSLLHLKERGYWIVGLDGEADALVIYDVDLDLDLVLVVGAEGRGLRPRVRGACDLRVRLPMAGRIGSLNASAACAAAVYQVLRNDSGRRS